MRIPDFFMIGAPKCGTTSIYHYLRAHPRIFMPANKEPHFFATDFPDFRSADSESRYLELFAGAGEDQILGEASTWYLYSEAALSTIKRWNPDARFIVFVRNPIEMAPALHSQLVYSLREPLGDFAAAWRAQDARRGCAHRCRNPEILRYGRVCSLGSRLSAALSHLDRSVLKIVVMDDLRTSPRQVYMEILSFLGLPDDGRTSFPVYNDNKRHRSARLARLLRQPPAPIRLAKRMAKSALRPFSDRPGDLVRSLHSQRATRPVLDSRLRAELRDYFEPDVAVLAGLLGRDLSHWLA
jgi:hypothetical protein